MGAPRPGGRWSSARASGRPRGPGWRPGGPPARSRSGWPASNGSRLAPGGWTLRLRATDAAGNAGEDRDFFYAIDARGLKAGYPRTLGTSGEASPALADLDGDGASEIVLATADGLVRVYSGRTAQDAARAGRRRWAPPPARRPRRGGSGRCAAASSAPRPSATSSGDRRPEVVAAGCDGRIYAWDRRGRPAARLPLPDRPARRRRRRGASTRAIYASPAARRPGPATAGSTSSSARPTSGSTRYAATAGRCPAGRCSRATASDRAKILSSPAIGDLDGDGSPDVVEGTAEAYGSTPSTDRPRLRVSSDAASCCPAGRSSPRRWPPTRSRSPARACPTRRCWPTSTATARRGRGGGVHRPARALRRRRDPDGRRGRDRGALPGTGRGASSPANAPAVLALGANAAFGAPAPGGPLRFFGGRRRLPPGHGAAVARLAHGPFEHLLGGWDAASGSWLAAFPRPMEGWQILSAPTVADVDGDGRSEVLAGWSGNVLHAFREDGSEPAGWPKQTRAAGCSPPPRWATSTATACPRWSRSPATAGCSSGTRRRRRAGTSGRPSATTPATRAATAEIERRDSAGFPARRSHREPDPGETALPSVEPSSDSGELTLPRPGALGVPPQSFRQAAATPPALRPPGVRIAAAIPPEFAHPPDRPR